jgi:hypothetical protein
MSATLSTDHALRCPHCGARDWSRAPRLAAIRAFALSRSGTTAAEVVERFGIAIANASNQLTRLVTMGELVRGDPEPHSSGGVFYTYRRPPSSHP